MTAVAWIVGKRSTAPQPALRGAKCQPMDRPSRRQLLDWLRSRSESVVVVEVSDTEDTNCQYLPFLREYWGRIVIVALTPGWDAQLETQLLSAGADCVIDATDGGAQLREILEATSLHARA